MAIRAVVFLHYQLYGFRDLKAVGKIGLAFWLAILITGCATTGYNYDAFYRAKPRSILVIPPLNNSVEVNAPYIFLSTISKPLAEKGYYVYPVAVIDQFLKENGLPTPAEMNRVPLDKLRENIGADAVLYTTIEQWGQKYEILSSRAVVSAKLRLVDARTGGLLWDGHAYAQYKSSDGGGGIVGALVGAVVTQVLSSAQDQTPGLSQQANQQVIQNYHSGLPDGPYRPAGK